MDGRNDVLDALLYVIDADAPFLCGKNTLAMGLHLNSRNFIFKTIILVQRTQDGYNR